VLRRARSRAAGSVIRDTEDTDQAEPRFEGMPASLSTWAMAAEDGATLGPPDT